MTKCKCLCHKEVPSGTIRAFSHIEDCSHMTKWKEQFDKRYVVPFDDGTNDKFINVNPEILKAFISNLIEQVIEDIPDKWEKIHGVIVLDNGTRMSEGTTVDISKLKQQLRDKYLNN